MTHSDLDIFGICSDHRPTVSPKAIRFFWGVLGIPSEPFETLKWNGAQSFWCLPCGRIMSRFYA